MKPLDWIKAHVDITPGFLLIAAGFTALAGPRRALMALFAVGVHELGHLSCLTLCGGEVRALRLTAVGAEIRLLRPLSYAGEFWTALSGPFAGALLSAGSLAAGEIAGWAAAYELGAVSILYTLFNLLPVSPMDGGRALSAAVGAAFGPRAAYLTGAAADLICLLLLLGGGIYVFFVSGYNISLLICALFLARACCKKSRLGVK